MQFDLLDEDLVGKHTPDPLRYAFSRKMGAHAGGMMKTPDKEQWQAKLTQAHLQSLAKTSSNPRCLYIHVPFCRVRCTYCNFFQYASSATLIESYVTALCEEIKWKASFTWSQAAPFQAVYFGGGTPSDLNAEQISKIVTTVRAHFNLTTDCEITFEGRLNGFSLDKFEAALEAGINRFSFGVQSFNTFVRRKAKRLDDKEFVLKQLDLFASYQKAPVVIDLLYGLPHQSLEIWQQDLHDYLDSAATGVDLYQLIDMQGLPMAKMVEQGRLPPPADTPMKASMFEMGVDFMAQHFEKRLSVNHWSKDNKERSLYNTLAKTSAEILPLGAGAGGNVNGLQMMQTRSLEEYTDAIKNRQFPVAFLSKMSPLSPIFGVIKAGFDKGLLHSKALDDVAGKAIFHTLMPLFSAWEKRGLVTVTQTEKQGIYLSLTLAGQFWNVTLSQALIRVLQQNSALLVTTPSLEQEAIAV